MQLQREAKRLTDAEIFSLVQNRKDSFYRVAYGCARNPEDAKDIVQQAVYKADVNKHELKETDKFYPWFYYILTNAAITWLRHSSHMELWQQSFSETGGTASFWCRSPEDGWTPRAGRSS